MTEQDSFNERLAAIARALLREPDVQATLQRTVAEAADTLDGELYSSVSLVLQRRQVETPVHTDERALRADQLQYELGMGPCLDAVWEQDTFHIDDLTGRTSLRGLEPPGRRRDRYPQQPVAAAVHRPRHRRQPGGAEPVLAAAAVLRRRHPS